MAKLVTADYHAKRLKNRPENPGRVAQAFFDEQDRVGAFPYDHADDPAFFCAQHFNRSVTWGVCRTDARNIIEPGDWVAFFSAEKDAHSSETTYCAAAFLKVAAKVSGRTPPPEFEDYLNRMVYSEGANWVHREPALQRLDWHDDWLWRISRRAYRRMADAELLGQMGHVADAHWLQRGSDAHNYIVFDESISSPFEEPRIVARHSRGEACEVWANEALTLQLRDELFGRDSTRWLRTTNRGQPHRHTRRQVDDIDVHMLKARALAVR